MGSTVLLLNVLTVIVCTVRNVSEHILLVVMNSVRVEVTTTLKVVWRKIRIVVITTVILKENQMPTGNALNAIVISQNVLTVIVCTVRTAFAHVHLVVMGYVSALITTI